MNAKTKKVSKGITEQYNTMIERGIIPVFELEIVNDDFLLVNLDLHYPVQGLADGLQFTFDTDDLDVSFDGEIVVLWDGCYYLPFDEYTDSLDSYLEQIMCNLQEGYLIPNNLFPSDD